MRPTTSSVFHRRGMPHLAEASTTSSVVTSSGDGSMVTGKIDISSGAGVACLGYRNTEIKQAMAEQIAQLPYLHSGLWTCQALEDIAAWLIRKAARACPRFEGGKVFFLNSGAEANEAACKLATQYLSTRDATPKFFGRECSYHGNTIFTLALSDHPRREMYSLDVNSLRVGRLPGFAPSWVAQELSSGLRFSLSDYEDMVIKSTKNDLDKWKAYTPVIILEPVGGTAIGIEPGTGKYLSEVRKAVDHRGGVLIYDEILCGNYRTGPLFSFEALADKFDVGPDIITIGKGLTGGYFPMSAVIVARHIVEAIEKEHGYLNHSTTNMNSSVGAAAAVAACKFYETHLAQNSVGKMISYMYDSVIPRLARNFRPDGIHQVTGIGTLWGVRYSNLANHRSVQEQLFEAGFAAYTEGGTRNGKGCWVLFAPPYSISPMELEKATSALIAVSTTAKQ